MQVLSSPTLRAMYDQELAAQALQVSSIPVADEVDFHDMTEEAGPQGIKYSLECRCGGAYTVSALEMAADNDLVLPCSNCSLHILLHHITR